MNRSDPFPRDARDLLLETLASAQATRALTYAIAEQIDLKRLIVNFEGSSTALIDKELGIDHPESYLEYLDRQCKDITATLDLLSRTS